MGIFRKRLPVFRIVSKERDDMRPKNHKGDWKFYYVQQKYINIFRKEKWEQVFFKFDFDDDEEFEPKYTYLPMFSDYREDCKDFIKDELERLEQEKLHKKRDKSYKVIREYKSREYNIEEKIKELLEKDD